jgi:hypothetical protein
MRRFWRLFSLLWESDQMTTLTSAGAAVNLTSTMNWSPAQIPQAGDDLIIGAATLTLDADLVLNSITFNSASSRIAVGGTVRHVSATNGFICFSSLMLATALPSGVSLTLSGTWSGAANWQLFSGAGGNLTLQTIGANPAGILVADLATVNNRILVGSWTGGTLTTIGRINLPSSSQGGTIVTMSGGTWTHTHTGTSFTGTSGNVLSATGSAIINWTGDLISASISVSPLFFHSGSGNIALSGTIARTAAAATSNFYNGSISAVLGLNAAYTGNVTITGKLCGSNRAISIVAAGASGSRINWRSQTLTISPGETVAILTGLAVVVDLTSLVVSNEGRFVFVEHGAASCVVDSSTLITNTTTSAQACVVSASGALGGRVINLASDAPTLPTVSQVAGGTVYGYAASPLTGTGVIADPAVIAAAAGAAMTTALNSISSTALARFASVNTGQTGAADGSVAKLAQGQLNVTVNPTVLSAGSISDIRSGLGTTTKQDDILAAINGLETGGLTPTQAEQMNRVEAQTSKLSGSPVTVNGNVKPGGQIVLKHGDNHLVSLLNSVPVPVDDVGGSLHTLMAAVGVNNLAVAAIRGSDPASRISGTVAALNYASNMLTVTMEFTAAESGKGVVGPVYTYDVYRLDNPTRTFFSGKLTVTRDARP